ncbi:MAG: AAA family ATPase [Treponema sp.]|nr:AAA family ATPase [Treponema sp.]
MTVNLFKDAYKITRPNGKEIYKGFGFKHHSDVTQYYVHPDNQSQEGTTSLCQPIGEAVIIFSILMQGIVTGKTGLIGDYYYNDDKSCFMLELKTPEELIKAAIISKEAAIYRAYLKDNSIHFGAFRKDGSFIEDEMEPLSSLYKMLPCFLVLLAREMETNADFSPLVENFLESPAADIFVNIHEDFYQNHKSEDYSLAYTKKEPFDPSKFLSCSSTYTAIKENKKQTQEVKEIEIKQFSKSSFKKEYFDLIPHLSEEFVLQKELMSLCNAVYSSDSRATLFHGPAGTGKTMSCKLICQAIGLPIMDTVNCTENLDEFILGKYIPQDDKIVFIESYVTKAVRDGGAVVFEEINFAKPQYLAFLNSLLDDNGFVRLDSGEIVKRHPNFRFFATMNVGYYGTRELNQALFNRFNSVIALAELSDDAIKKMLSARIPECVPFMEKMLGVYKKIKKKIETEELEIVISPRNLENWARIARHDGYVLAAEKTILPVAKNDKTLEGAIRGIIYLYRWT